jgi:hypothetical protein
MLIDGIRQPSNGHGYCCSFHRVWNRSAHVRTVSCQWNDLVKRIFFVFQVSDSVPQHLPAGDVNHLPVIAIPALRNQCLLIGIIVSLALF